ncbi:UDP-N-acetylmuramate dehydrogenase [Serratia entomophila]|uniref:UDP-N-acetylmuramate dehydrogenase n=1 Tax=Serratia entomophila TaxID=42906 RepID=UPI0021788FBD|nr:UDP-N-acetylmuramate dehydrogenase [Serratia entomophila]CAI1166120.1 UDP-N-acetylenolpyruvoylglucosamine reductase [Serratia entomophila]CAI1171582.1 UDP-N-acetylenolpyruvoylglucosamine reductase [Serratia entomophila]CAI1173293.1 UDP-N-acetylenolpyruvoylglucosamine reductase [Serratia entomophila]CAI1175906.1 UDP-N-acetylenolpyruvoylglucosamine reductase [Serratia entomophila]CAI1987791.1 UDP-N-acetylenolpyruvoylglucosamine reductase [Serratia entomophila]
MSTESASLKNHNTFALPVNAAHLIMADRIELMLKVWQQTRKRQEPLLVLGEGSNVLFLEDFAGTVMINQLKGIDIREERDAWHLHVSAGENWHDLVCYTLQAGIPGLENLALIPGLAGSAPIQNIGAYGIELKSVCEYVDLLDFSTGAIDRIPAAECGFGYRESIFKHQFQTGHIIVGLGLRLSKQWRPMLEYGDLTKLDPATVTSGQIFDSVCAMRRSKLPDPRETGNAGSFFKNPLVSAEKSAKLIAQYPAMPHYPQADGQVKLAAGWLIDQCELKGYRIGGAAVHRQQALVLVNVDNAVSEDVVALARHVRNTVASRFDVWLEPEVRFIGASGELNAIEALA